MNTQTYISSPDTDQTTSLDDYLTPTGSPIKSKVWNRPVFQTGRGQPITAGGMLLMCRQPADEQVYFLLSRTENTGSGKLPRYEDIGGKTETPDRTIEECIAREGGEELNAAFRPSLTNQSWLPNHPGWRQLALSQPSITEPPTNFRQLLQASQQLLLSWFIKIDRRQIRSFYIRHSKYRLLVMEMPSSWMTWRPSAYFGQKELYEQCIRTCHWVSARQFIKFHVQRQVNPRLNHTPLRYLITELAKNWQVRLSISPPPRKTVALKNLPIDSMNKSETVDKSICPLNLNSSSKEIDEMMSKMDKMKIE